MLKRIYIGAIPQIASVTSFFQNYVLGLEGWVRMLAVMLIAMLPIVELRGSIIIGAMCGLPWLTTLVLSFIGSILPCPFIIFLGEKLLHFLAEKVPFMRRFSLKVQNTASKKAASLRKAAYWGLFAFVAIPVPGTGVWMGSLIASVLDLDIKKAITIVSLGSLVAGLIMTMISYGLLPFALPWIEPVVQLP